MYYLLGDVTGEVNKVRVVSQYKLVLTIRKEQGWPILTVSAQQPANEGFISQHPLGFNIAMQYGRVHS